MRHRINVSITPVFHDELQRICKDYGFVNLCEICTALLRFFVDRVNNAEQNKGRRLERNEDLIKQMFAEFENWEPTPQPDIMYKRHPRRNPDNVQPRKPRAAAATVWKIRTAALRIAPRSVTASNTITKPKNGRGIMASLQ